MITRERGVLKGPHYLIPEAQADDEDDLQTYDVYRWEVGECVGVVLFDEDKIARGKWVYGGGYGNRGSRRIPRKRRNKGKEN